MSGSFHLSDGYDPNKSNATTPTKMSNEKKNDGGQAFPMQYSTRKRCDTQDGMTLRDYFAAKAIQVYLPLSTEEGCEEDGPWTHTARKQAARHAYLMADAMLKAREE